MSQNRRFITQCALGALLAVTAMAPAPATAEEFRINRFFVVGDSLSDAGAYTQGVTLGGAPAGPLYKFTTNALDGSSLVWSQVLANSLGITQGPDVLEGVPLAGPFAPTVNVNGGNYAQGGSRVALQPGVIGGLTPAQGFTTIPGTVQIDRLLADSPTLSGSDLVAVWLGANDVFTQYGSLPFGLPLAVATANLQTAATELVAQVDRLVAAGAKNIIVVSVPDIGTTPFGVSQAGVGGDVILTGMVNTFNQTLYAGLAGKPAVIVDSGKLLGAIQADPVKYGFTAPGAALLPACLPAGASSLTCIQGLNALPDSETRVFADGVHPTAAAHALFGQAGFAGLQAGTQVGTMAVATITALRQQSLGLENRLTPLAFSEAGPDGKPGRRAVGSIEKFGSIEGGYYEAGAEQVRPGLSATTEVIKAGGDIMVAPNALVGAGISLDHGQVDFDGQRGGFDSRLFVGAIYGTVALSQSFYLNAAGAAGYVDVYDIERSFMLGPAREKYGADTNGTYVMARFGGGMLARVGPWVLNPAAALTYERVRLDGFTESNGAASLAFGDTEFYATRLSGSITATYVPPEPDGWRTILRASIEHDIQDDELIVKMGPSQANLGFVTAPRPDSTFGYLSAQFIKPLASNSSIGLSASSVVGLEGSLGFTGTATYKIKF